MQTLNILQSHYPERLGMAVCYHAPRLFSFSFKVHPAKRLLTVPLLDVTVCWQEPSQLACCSVLDVCGVLLLSACSLGPSKVTLKVFVFQALVARHMQSPTAAGTPHVKGVADTSGMLSDNLIGVSRLFAGPATLH